MMNLKSIIVALVGAGVVGSAFAASGHGAVKHDHSDALWWQNSVQAPQKNFVKNSGFYIGAMANIDAVVNHNALLQDSMVVWNNSLTKKTNSNIFISNANVLAGYESKNLCALVNIRYDNRAAFGASVYQNVNTLGVDEAFAVLHTADNSYYAKVGKFYNAFGSYNPYAMVYSLTQEFSQVSSTGLEVGANMSGVFANASFYSPNSQYHKVSYPAQRNLDNASFNLGYSNSSYGMLKVGYMLDARNSYADQGAAKKLALPGNNKDVGAIAVNAKLAGSQLGGFSAGFNYLYLEAKNLSLANNKGAWFMGLNGAYAFSGLTKQDSLGVGFEMASESVTKDANGGIGTTSIPQYRVSADYGVQINKWVGASVMYMFNRFNTAAKKYSGNTFGLRLSTAF